jgi:hypothetical protein
MAALPNVKYQLEQVLESVLKEINDEDERKRRERRVRKTTVHELAAPITDTRMALLELVLKLEGVP